MPTEMMKIASRAPGESVGEEALVVLPAQGWEAPFIYYARSLHPSHLETAARGARATSRSDRLQDAILARGVLDWTIPPADR